MSTAWKFQLKMQADFQAFENLSTDVDDKDQDSSLIFRIQNISMMLSQQRVRNWQGQFILSRAKTLTKLLNFLVFRSKRDMNSWYVLLVGGDMVRSRFLKEINGMR